MFNLRKETECAIFLLKYLGKNKKDSVSLKTVAKNLDLSFLFLQKIARKLRQGGLISASQGVHGGYNLDVLPTKLNLRKILEVMQDDCLLLECMRKGKNDCPKYKKCSVRIGLEKLNKKVIKMMEEVLSLIHI